MVVMITKKDTKTLKYCMRGIRKFLIRHGLSYEEFRKKGIPADVAENTGDAMAIELARIARGKADSRI